MISRNLSSEERSPPLASGWWRLVARSLYRALILAWVAAPSRVLGRHPGPSSAQRVVSRRGLRLFGASHAATTRRAGLSEHRFVDMTCSGCPRAKLPGRPVANRVSLAELRQRLVVHAAEIIVSGVVFAHVVHAEAEIFALLIAALGRAEHAFGLAARMAARAASSPPPVLHRALGRLTLIRSNRREFRFMS